MVSQWTLWSKRKFAENCSVSWCPSQLTLVSVWAVQIFGNRSHQAEEGREKSLGSGAEGEVAERLGSHILRGPIVSRCSPEIFPQRGG